MSHSTVDTPSTDRIEKRIEIRAPLSRVWRAISDAREFGAWFGWKVEGNFAEGATMRGKITHKGNEHPLELTVERIRPETYFSYRWHPFAIDLTADILAEPMTLVEFKLEEIEDGTAVTIVESGFDGIPISRRAEAFRMNTMGWASQLAKLERHVA